MDTRYDVFNAIDGETVLVVNTELEARLWSYAIDAFDRDSRIFMDYAKSYLDA